MSRSLVGARPALAALSSPAGPILACLRVHRVSLRALETVAMCYRNRHCGLILHVTPFIESPTRKYSFWCSTRMPTPLRFSVHHSQCRVAYTFTPSIGRCEMNINVNTLRVNPFPAALVPAAAILVTEK